MKLPPYHTFPNITGDKIMLRQIQLSDVNDIIEISFYDAVQGNGELGCMLLPSFRGQGFMTASMSLAIDFGINYIGLTRIWAETTRQNEQAIKLLERLNFVSVANLEDHGVTYELRREVLKSATS